MLVACAQLAFFMVVLLMISATAIGVVWAVIKIVNYEMDK